jgi:hypothetical protein
MAKRDNRAGNVSTTIVLIKSNIMWLRTKKKKLRKQYNTYCEKCIVMNRNIVNFNEFNYNLFVETNILFAKFEKALDIDNTNASFAVSL